VLIQSSKPLAAEFEEPSTWQHKSVDFTCIVFFSPICLCFLDLTVVGSYFYRCIENIYLYCAVPTGLYLRHRVTVLKNSVNTGKTYLKWWTYTTPFDTCPKIVGEH
jgi:hypothetical protein